MKHVYDAEAKGVWEKDTQLQAGHGTETKPISIPRLAPSVARHLS